MKNKTSADPYGKPANEDIARLRHLCRTNLKFLCKEILEMDKWDDVLHDDLERFLMFSGSHKLVLIPRGHLKSSIVTVGWTIQQILINPNLRILIRNGVWEQSRIFLRQISAYLSSGLLVKIFGEFCLKDSIWTKEVVNIAQHTSKTGREPTFTTAGLETALTGLHFDLILDDDLVGQQNTTTKEQIQKVIDVYEDSHSLLDRGGRHVVIGTRWSNKDLYGYLLTADTCTLNGLPMNKSEGVDAWRNIYFQWLKSGKIVPFNSARFKNLGRYDAYVRRAEENGKAIFARDFCVTDNEKYKLKLADIDKESIETLKRNPRAYACQYNNDPLDDDLIEFKRDWFQRFERTPELNKQLSSTPAILSVDPAFRLKQTNDYTGLVVTKCTPDGFIYVLEAKQIKLNPAKLVDEIFNLVDIYKPQKVLIETVSAQILLVDLLKNRMRDLKKFFTIEEMKTSTTETKAMRIRSLVPYYANGQILHAPGLSDLESQLLEFPRGLHDDVIDALAYQSHFWKKGQVSKIRPQEKEFTFNWWLQHAHRPKTSLDQLFKDLRG